MPAHVTFVGANEVVGIRPAGRSTRSLDDRAAVRELDRRVDAEDECKRAPAGMAGARSRPGMVGEGAAEDPVSVYGK